MELTVEVRREENGHYTAEITGTDSAELADRITEARTLSELPAYLEDLIQICLEDKSAQVIAPPLQVGTIQVAVVAENHRS